MRIDFLGLQAFVSIAEYGSFQQAAAHLNLSHTALSHRMKKFEAYFGVNLLTRTSRQVTLTPAGLDLLPSALQIMNDLQNSMSVLVAHGASKQQHLAIGCIPTLASCYLPAVLGRFSETHPDITVKVYDNSAAEIAARVKAGTAEFAITIASADRSDLHVRPLLKESFVLVAPSAHPLASRKFVHWADLRDCPLVRISSQTGNRMLIDDALREHNEGLLWRYEVQLITTALSMVLAGVGLAIVPQLAAGSVQSASLVVIPLRNPSINRKIAIISRRGGQLSPAAADLIKLIQKEMSRIRLRI